MNGVYASPYYPAYAAPQAQYGLVPVNQIQYPLAMTGADPTAPIVPAPAPAAGPLTLDYWKKPGPGGIPMWAIPAGLAALTTIGLLWSAGKFGGTKSTTTVRRTSSARDAGRKMAAAPARDHRRKTTKKKSSHARRGHHASRGGFGSWY